MYLGSFFLDPEDIRVLGVGAIWNLLKEQGSYKLVENRGHKGPVLRRRCIRSGEGPNPNTILFYSTGAWLRINYYLVGQQNISSAKEGMKIIS